MTAKKKRDSSGSGVRVLRVRSGPEDLWRDLWRFARVRIAGSQVGGRADGQGIR